MSDLQLPSWLADIKCLPVIPHDVHRLIGVFSDDSLDYKQLAKLLEAHQSIASRLLMLANSAWANTGVEVTTLEQACLKLGLNIVRGVSIGLAVMRPFNVAYCPAFDLKRYWVTSMLVAHGAALLANQMPAAGLGLHFVKTARTAGMLHNIGLLCLADLKPQETLKVLRFKEANPQVELAQVFRSEMMTDYCEIGGMLASVWGMPNTLVASIQYHRAPDYDGPYSEHAKLVGIAAEWVSLLYRREPMLVSAYLERRAIDPASQERVFAGLAGQFQQACELAATLFP